MSTPVRTQQGESVDALCWRHYGRTQGAVEAVLSVAFTAVGIPSSIAVSATLVYRIAFYWLRIPVGALAMKWLDMHNLI